jgi:AcrR family transcriptional regulator
VIADRILSRARTSFSEHGYAGTSLRRIAQNADVDPALVTYYFKSKSGLLDAVLASPPAWTEALTAAAGRPL